MEDILQKIVLQKRKEVALLKANYQNELLHTFSTLSRSTISLKNALLQSASGIIVEFKRKSPSKGRLNAHAEPLAVIPAYEQAGATALSVLTDSISSGGHLQDIQKARQVTRLPILRKDFILDEIQLLEAHVAGADAVLLIAACLHRKNAVTLPGKPMHWVWRLYWKSMKKLSWTI